MSDIIVTGYGESEVPQTSNRRDTPFRAAVELAVRNSVACRGRLSDGSVSLPPNSGIAFLTETGERWPEVWGKAVLAGQRARPTQYGSIVHNSAAGQAAIALKLTGPQIALVTGDILEIAALQIKIGRARLMIACALEQGGSAISLVLETDTSRPHISLSDLTMTSMALPPMLRFSLQYLRAEARLGVTI